MFYLLVLLFIQITALTSINLPIPLGGIGPRLPSGPGGIGPLNLMPGGPGPGPLIGPPLISSPGGGPEQSKHTHIYDSPQNKSIKEWQFIDFATELQH